MFLWIQKFWFMGFKQQNHIKDYNLKCLGFISPREVFYGVRNFLSSCSYGFASYKIIITFCFLIHLIYHWLPLWTLLLHIFLIEHLSFLGETNKCIFHIVFILQLELQDRRKSRWVLRAAIYGWHSWINDIVMC